MPNAPNAPNALDAKGGNGRILHPGDPGYPLWVDGKLTAGHITEGELRGLLRVDAFCRGRT